MSSPDLPETISTIAIASRRVLPILFQSPSLQTLYHVIIGLNPVVTSFWLMFLLIAAQVLISTFTFSISWNDRAWPIIPLIHVVLYAIHPIISANPEITVILDARLRIMVTLVFLWSMRLTAHAISRGVYAYGAVDYRYGWIQENIIRSQVIFGLFYVVIICFGMTVLLTLVTAPMYFAWVSRNRVPLSIVDAIATVAMIASIVIENVADSQQQAFQAVKASFRARSQIKKAHSEELSKLESDASDGFLQSGLFAYCRHPNFCAELATWFSFHLFSIAAGGALFNWTLLGPLLYVLLFQGSTAITERISVRKYPKYLQYQRCVPRLYFWFPKHRALREQDLSSD